MRGSVFSKRRTACKGGGPFVRAPRRTEGRKRCRGRMPGAGFIKRSGAGSAAV